MHAHFTRAARNFACDTLALSRRALEGAQCLASSCPKFCARICSREARYVKLRWGEERHDDRQMERGRSEGHRAKDDGKVGARVTWCEEYVYGLKLVLYVSVIK